MTRAKKIVVCFSDFKKALTRWIDIIISEFGVETKLANTIEETVTSAVFNGSS